MHFFNFGMLVLCMFFCFEVLLEMFTVLQCFVANSAIVTHFCSFVLFVLSRCLEQYFSLFGFDQDVIQSPFLWDFPERNTNECLECCSKWFLAHISTKVMDCSVVIVFQNKVCIISQSGKAVLTMKVLFSFGFITRNTLRLIESAASLGPCSVRLDYLRALAVGFYAHSILTM